MTSNARFNRKKKISRMLLRNAFGELIKEMPIEKITIRELCERADVNRSTFYANYDDIYALSQELTKEYIALLLPIYDQYDEMDDRTFYLKQFQVIQSNAWLVSVIMHLNDNSIDKVFHDISYQQVVLPRKQNISEAEAAMLDMVFEYTFAGGRSLIRNWLLSGMTTSPEQLADILSTLSMRCVGTVDTGGEYKKIQTIKK